MFISSETIHIVQVVAKYRNISLAAEELNKVTSALSYTIRKLEDTIGTPLFDRTNRQLTLTPAGEYFIHYSKTILQDMKSLTRNTYLASSNTMSEFFVAVNNLVPEMAILEFVEQFEKQFPFTQLNLTTEVYNGCWDAFYSRKIDCVIGAPHFVPYSDGIISAEIGEMDWDFVVGKHHPLAERKTPLNYELLRQYSAICIKDTSTNFIPRQAWLLEGQKPVFVPNYTIAKQLIERHAGIGYLPHHFCKNELTTGRLIKKEMIEHKHPTKLFWAYYKIEKNEVNQWCERYFSSAKNKQLWSGKTFIQ